MCTYVNMYVMYVRMHICVYGWMDGWMGGCMHVQTISSCNFLCAPVTFSFSAPRNFMLLAHQSNCVE
jgi:hypothetical protein